MAQQHPDSADALRAKREEILRMRAELEAMLQQIDLDLQGDQLPHGQSSRRPSPSSRPRGRAVRELVLDALDDLGWPAYSRELSQYCEARYGRRTPPERFGTLATDEVNAYKKGSSRRPVWLCFCLTHDRHEPIKRLLARSDWPLERRIVAPTTGRVQHLQITSALCDLALRADETADDPEMMRIIAADHARDLPGINFERGKFDLEVWRDTARELLAELLHRDEQARRESAERLARRSEYFQLFGLPDVIEGVKPSRELQRDVL